MKADGFVDGMSHPLALAALAVLVLNDHWAKFRYPGWVTGKLSDVAILVVGPLALQGAWELVRPASPRPSRRVFAASVLVSAALYSLEKAWPPATEAYRVVWGVLRWPTDALRAWAHGETTPRWAPVVAVHDPTDLWCLPALYGAWIVQRARERRANQG